MINIDDKVIEKAINALKIENCFATNKYLQQAFFFKSSFSQNSKSIWDTFRINEEPFFSV